MIIKIDTKTMKEICAVMGGDYWTFTDLINWEIITDKDIKNKYIRKHRNKKRIGGGK